MPASMCPRSDACLDIWVGLPKLRSAALSLKTYLLPTAPPSPATPQQRAMRTLTAAKSAGAWSFSEPGGSSHNTTPCKNCQAESLRGLLSKAPSLPLTMTSNAGERRKNKTTNPFPLAAIFQYRRAQSCPKNVGTDSLVP